MDEMATLSKSRNVLAFGLSEQEMREGLEAELMLAMRTEGNVPTVHVFAHSFARLLQQDHMRIAEQLVEAGVRLT